MDRVRALLSVADRAGIADLARELIDQGIEVYATDGTRAALSEVGVELVHRPHQANIALLYQVR
jgi:AICAR transformylase/IMP cyclohydrolase PurH